MDSCLTPLVVVRVSKQAEQTRKRERERERKITNMRVVKYTV